jgi:membrane protease YdiL (CAAX protease family)
VRFNAGVRLAVFVGSVVIGMGVMALMGLIGAGFVGLATGGSDLTGALIDSIGFASAMELVAAIGGYVVLVCVLEGRGWPFELGWLRLGGLLKGILLGFVLITVNVGILALVGSYRVSGFNSGYSPWFDLLTAGVTAAVAEELIFRGAFFRILEDTIGSVMSLIVTAVIFGAIHLSNPDATLLGAVGIAIAATILPAVYLATRSLWWPIGVHFAWNVTQGPIWGSPISGTGPGRGMLRAEWSGPEWLTGGVFGIEASLILMVTVGLFSAWLLSMAYRSGNFTLPFWKRRRLLVAASQDMAPDQSL